jgi:hypothetical protein
MLRRRSRSCNSMLLITSVQAVDLDHVARQCPATARLGDIKLDWSRNIFRNGQTTDETLPESTRDRL